MDDGGSARVSGFMRAADSPFPLDNPLSTPAPPPRWNGGQRLSAGAPVSQTDGSARSHGWLGTPVLRRTSEDDSQKRLLTGKTREAVSVVYLGRCGRSRWRPGSSSLASPSRGAVPREEPPR